MASTKATGPGFWLFLIVFVVGVIEGLAYGTLLLSEKLHPGNVVEPFVDSLFPSTPPENYRIVREVYWQPEIGWAWVTPIERTSKEGIGEPWTLTIDSRGARGASTGYDSALVASYGDSFTLGHGVNNEETWQAVLSKELGTEVINYGVSGFSTLQATLRFEGHIAAGRRAAPITILTIAANDLQRSANRFVPYISRSSRQMFKFRPAARFINGELQVLPSLLRFPEAEYAVLPQLARDSAEGDFWAEQMARLQPPYTSEALNFLLRRLAARPLRQAKNDTGFFLKLPEGWALSNALVDRFLDACRHAGTQPILVIVPTNKYLSRRFHADTVNSPPSDYADLTAAVSLRYPDLPLLDMSQVNFDLERFSLRRFEGHASAYGNQVIATAIYNLLEQKSLLTRVMP